ncbi:MAG: T9SS type A sorting domain-containing protein [candidate division Zixibacteria bacterium]|nr:T9SS type A sorting domain-containing protein [candidate division Zixibacteria bacterium]
MKKSVVLLILICWFSTSDALIIRIPQDYPTISEGTNASMDGDTVMVSPGIYPDYVNMNGKNILLTSEQGPEVTFIERQIRGFNGNDTTTIIRGFDITENSSGTIFSGIYIYDGSSCIIEGNIIHDCVVEVTYSGGGISIDSPNRSSSIIRNNVIRDNYHDDFGGGIAINGHGFKIVGNIISSNYAGFYDDSWGAGGIKAGGSEFNISYNLIVDNQSGYWGPTEFGGGGAVVILRTSEYRSIISNNTFVNNRCYGYNENAGSGLVVFNAHELSVKNNIYAYNQQGGFHSTYQYDLDYNLFWQNEYGDYEGSQPGPNSLFEDPLFVNLDNGDYNLQEDSPCIDAGDPNSPLDPDSTRADIGCYYYHHITDVTEPDSSNSPHKFYLEQNYPNPFNGQTIISYYLSEASDVELNIINMKGELVSKPVNSHQSAGNHSLIWQGNRTDGVPVATGIYFYELKVLDSYTPQSREVKAMILLK